MRRKKVKTNSGDIIQIPFEDKFIYARVLNHGDFAFYDYISNSDGANKDDILNSPILFKAIVNDRGLNEGIWKIIENEPLEDNLKNSVYYLTDINPDYFRIAENEDIRNATKEECIGLPVGCIWDPIHIDQRLKDHYNGNENLALKMLDTLGNYKLK